MESKNSASGLRLKFRYLLMPFVWLTIAGAAVATVLHAVVVHLGWPPLSENWTEFIIPMVVAGGPLYLWLYPRLKRGVRYPKEGDGAFGVLLFAWLGAIPFLLVSQSWFAKAGEHLERARSIVDLIGAEGISCVELENYAVILHQGGWSDHTYTSGRSSQTLKFDLFFAAPIGRHAGDTVGPPIAWAVRSFHESMSSSASDAQERQAWSALVERARAELDAGGLEGASYLRNEHRSDDIAYYREAAMTSSRHDERVAPLFLSAHRGPFERSMGPMARYAAFSLLGGALWWWIVLLFLRVDRETVDDRISMTGEASSTWKRFIGVAIPRGDRFITIILVWLNVLAFLMLAFYGVGFMSMRTDGLLAWGADHGPLTLNGEYWRLLSSTFLHGGVVHLVMNMGGLVLGGVVLEQLIGRWTFMSFYLLCGIGASAASLWWAPDRVSVGASGAVFGLYGIILALAFFSRVELPDMKFLALLAALFVVYNLAMGMLNKTTDNAAHIGGLATGLACGILLGLVGRFKKTEFDPP